MENGWIGQKLGVYFKKQDRSIYSGLLEEKMRISEEYERLMLSYELPERFRAGDFGLLEEEITTLRDFVDSFYASVEENGCVTLEDFTEFMDFLAVIRDADSDAVRNLIAEVFMKSAEIRNRLSKQRSMV